MCSLCGQGWDGQRWGSAAAVLSNCEIQDAYLPQGASSCWQLGGAYQQYCSTLRMQSGVCGAAGEQSAEQYDLSTQTSP